MRVIFICLLSAGVVADRMDQDLVNQDRSLSGAAMLQREHSLVSNNKQENTISSCPGWCQGKANKKGWSKVCKWKKSCGAVDSSGRPLCRQCDTESGEQCPSNSCTNCGGCSSSACKEGEQCCNKFKDFQNKISDVQNKARDVANNPSANKGWDCAKELKKNYDRSDLKKQCTGGSLPCMKCFGCKSDKLDFCPNFRGKEYLDCANFEYKSLLATNTSLQDPDDVQNAALLSRAAAGGDSDIVQTTDTTVGGKHCL